jgi:nucleotide sugar dehydrogenase
MFNYREALLQGDKQIGVWGIGHIGYSTICHFAERGVRVLGTDVDADKVAAVSRGENPIFAMDYWLGFTPGYLFENGVARATTDYREVLSDDTLVHFICIPTERDGKPNLDILADVCRKLTYLRDRSSSVPPLVIIESTLTPNTTDEFVIPIFEAANLKIGEDILLGCAPRRDWFATPDKSLRTLPRIIGGTNPETTQVMKEVLGSVCENLIPAPDHLHAEVVKSIENAYRHMEISLANELTLAYPHLDMRTVLNLVGTKWNVGTFHPSFGIGGYCIPLASHYVLQGAKQPELLSLLQATIASAESFAEKVADSIARRRNVRRVGVLGLSYTKNVKVWSQSPTVKIVPILRERGLEVKVHDPHYTAEEIRRIVGTETFEFPGGMGEFDAILVVAGHREYAAITHGDIMANMPNCRLVLDNAELWNTVDFARNGIEYHQAGDRNWLGTATAPELVAAANGAAKS